MKYDSLLACVSKPSRYLGNEINAVQKDWDSAELRMALIFPDLYEIGMSHQGLQILYHIVNSHDAYLADRAYAPDRDFEKLLRQHGQPLFAVESGRPLGDFDVLGITLPYELCYTNILTILDLAGLPFRAVDRSEEHPLVIAGGPCAFHPEPVAEFFDAILLGDGEEAVLEVAEVIRDAKRRGLSRATLLDRLSMIEGMYVPSMFEPQYGQDGRFQGMLPLKEGHDKVRRRILPDLDEAPGPFPPLVPLMKIVHDRLGIEIARGCTRGCRFCQAGIIYRPVRERSPELILDTARAGIDQGGFEELALLSLSTGDYSCLSDVLVQLMDELASQRVSVSMPSMRVGTLTPEIMEQIRRVRKTGFTLAPEAGTDRLRRVINKGITEEDLLETCRSAFSLGWKLIKLYFMFGLPTETSEDVEAIPALAQKALRAGVGGGRKINVSAATFVPKPHTPFEREAQLGVEEGFARIDLLKERLRPRGFQLKWHDPRQSFLEGVMARGDRRLSDLIEQAWGAGARLDAWTDLFDLAVWQNSAETCGINLSEYLRKRQPEEILPWHHLDVGVAEAFLKAELDNALKEVYTQDCRIHGCSKCGLCDFKTIKPRTYHKQLKVKPKGVVAQRFNPEEAAKPNQPIDRTKHFPYLFWYEKTGKSRFLSHLELIQVFFRAFRRVGLPVHFSQGFNPTPKVSFGPALPLGTESLSEFLSADLYEPLPDPAAVAAAVNSQLPNGLVVKSVEVTAKQLNGPLLSSYRVGLAKPVSASDFTRFFTQERFEVELTRKGKSRQIDAKPLVKELSATANGKIHLVMASEPGKAGVKPLEFVTALVGLTEQEVLAARVVKQWIKEPE